MSQVRPKQDLAAGAPLFAGLADESRDVRDDGEAPGLPVPPKRGDAPRDLHPTVAQTAPPSASGRMIPGTSGAAFGGGFGGDTFGGDTRRAAYRQIASELSDLERLVLVLIHAAGDRGLTNEQISERSTRRPPRPLEGIPEGGRYMPVPTVCGRVRALSGLCKTRVIDPALIRDSGRRRETLSGAKAKVWVLTAEGLDAVSHEQQGRA